jgi:hypothetical protein
MRTWDGRPQMGLLLSADGALAPRGDAKPHPILKMANLFPQPGHNTSTETTI